MSDTTSSEQTRSHFSIWYGGGTDIYHTRNIQNFISCGSPPSPQFVQTKNHPSDDVVSDCEVHLETVFKLVVVFSFKENIKRNFPSILLTLQVTKPWHINNHHRNNTTGVDEAAVTTAVVEVTTVDTIHTWPVIIHPI